ncbi:MAG: hypothetical protein Q9222_000085 [Ikaeria aurantiellina]
MENHPVEQLRARTSQNRPASGDLSQVPAKSPRTMIPELVTAAAETRGLLPQITVTKVPATGQVQEQSNIDEAKRTFMSKWAKKTKAAGDWQSLAKYVYTTKGKVYESFEELEDMVNLVWDIRRAEVEAYFRKSVCAWIDDDSNRAKAIKTP